MLLMCFCQAAFGAMYLFWRQRGLKSCGTTAESAYSLPTGQICRKNFSYTWQVFHVNEDSHCEIKFVIKYTPLPQNWLRQLFDVRF